MAGDPWSGHMAFPGRRVEAEDSHSHGTADRETREEIDLDLSPAERLGNLSDLVGHNRRIVVTVHGYWWDSDLDLNYKVADALWLGLDVRFTLLD